MNAPSEDGFSREQVIERAKELKKKEGMALLRKIALKYGIDITIHVKGLPSAPVPAAAQGPRVVHRMALSSLRARPPVARAPAPAQPTGEVVRGSTEADPNIELPASVLEDEVAAAEKKAPRERRKGAVGLAAIAQMIKGGPPRPTKVRKVAPKADATTTPQPQPAKAAPSPAEARVRQAAFQRLLGAATASPAAPKPRVKAAVATAVAAAAVAPVAATPPAKPKTRPVIATSIVASVLKQTATPAVLGRRSVSAAPRSAPAKVVLAKSASVASPPPVKPASAVPAASPRPVTKPAAPAPPAPAAAPARAAPSPRVASQATRAPAAVAVATAPAALPRAIAKKIAVPAAAVVPGGERMVRLPQQGRRFRLVNAIEADGTVSQFLVEDTSAPAGHDDDEADEVVHGEAALADSEAVGDDSAAAEAEGDAEAEEADGAEAEYGDDAEAEEEAGEEEDVVEAEAEAEEAEAAE